MIFDKDIHRCIYCDGELEEVECENEGSFTCLDCGMEYDISDLEEEYEDDGYCEAMCEYCGNLIDIPAIQGCFTCPECGSPQNI